MSEKIGGAKGTELENEFLEMEKVWTIFLKWLYFLEMIVLLMISLSKQQSEASKTCDKLFLMQALSHPSNKRGSASIQFLFSHYVDCKPASRKIRIILNK